MASKEIENKVQSIENELETVNAALGRGDTLLGKMSNGFGNIVESATKLTSIIAGGGLVIGLTDAARASWDLNNSMTSLSMQMGKGAEGIKELQNNVTGMMKDIGSSYDDAKNIVTQLAEMKYQGDMSEAAKSVDMFSRATGVSNGNVIQLTESLNKQAGLSTKSTTAILAGMTAVQQKVGISKRGMEALSENIIDVSNNMAAFGKSSEDIKRMAVNTTALVGAMEKVGVSAQTTLGIIERLTDPERLEDNILLYSQLGISFEDAMSGNVEVTDGMLQQLGERIKAMGPMAGSAFAQSMGLHYKDLVKMSNATEDITGKVAEEANIKEDEALDKLQGLMSQAEGFGKKVSNFFNKLKGTLMSLGPILLSLGAFITMAFKSRKNKLASVATDTKKMIKGIGESAEQVVDKTTMKLSKRLQVLFSNNKDAGDFFSKLIGDPVGGAVDRYYESGATIKKETQKANQEGMFASFTSRYDEYSNIMGGKEFKDLTVSEQARANLLEEELKSIRKRLKLENIENENLYNYLGNYKGIEEKQKTIASKQEEINNIIGKSGSLTKEIDNLQNAIKNGSLADNKQAQEKLQALKLQGWEYKQQLKSLEKQNQELEEQEKKFKDIKNQIEKINDETESPKNGLSKFLTGTKDRITSSFNNWKGGIVQNRLDSGKATTGFLGGVGLAKDMTKGVLKTGLGKLGVISMAVTSIMGLVSSFMPDLANGMKETLTTVKDGIMGALKPLGEHLLKIFNLLVRMVVPPLLRVLSGIMALTGIVQTVVGFLFSWSKLGKAIMNTGKSMIAEVTPSLWGAANNLSIFNKNFDKEQEAKKEQIGAINDNTDALTGGMIPAIDVRGAKLYEVNGSPVSVGANSSVGSTTQSVVVEESDEKKAEQSNKDQKETEYKETIRKEISESKYSLNVLTNLLKDILNALLDLNTEKNSPQDVAGPNL